MKNRYIYEILTLKQELLRGSFTTKLSREGKVKKFLLEKLGLELTDCASIHLENHGNNR